MNDKDSLGRSTGSDFGTMQFWGILALIVGLALTAGAFYFISGSFPDAPTPRYGESIDLAAYKAQLSAAKTSIAIRAALVWVGDKMIAAGFFIWLGGCVIKVIREHSAD